MKTLLDRYRALTLAFPDILKELEEELAPGRVLLDLERAAQDAVLRRGFESNFKGFHGYPAFITASLNDDVMNTVPDERRLQDGDLLKLQVGIRGLGAHAYQSWTYAIGRVSAADRRLIDAARQGLEAGVEAVGTGSVAAISKAIQAAIEAGGFAANGDYVGHGMGEKQHQDPQIPCRAFPGYDARLAAGQVLSIQSIAHAGSARCRTLKNGNVKAADGKRAVMFSRMVLVGEGPLLPPRDPYRAVGPGGEGRPPRC